MLFLQNNHLWKAYDYLIATGIGFVLSVLWSFFWNNKFVFTVGEGEKRSVLKALLKTYVSYSFTGLFLNSFFNGIMGESVRNFRICGTDHQSACQCTAQLSDQQILGI